MEMLLDKEHINYYNQELFAKAGSATLYEIAKTTPEERVIKEMILAKEHLISKEPNNIVLKNTILYFLFQLPQKNIKEEAKERHEKILKRINQANKEISQHTTKKIKQGSTIFVHSVNNQIKETLLYAAKHKTFFVNLVEHRPFLFGTHLAKELNEKGTKTTLFSDISIKEAIQGADLCLIGGEAITRKKGAIAKEGSSTAAEAAKKQNTPVYICANSLKYNHKHRTEKANSTHQEYISPENITAYVCEYGIFKPNHIQEELRFYNSWMFI